MRVKNNSRGFTLIELLVVVSILGTLSSVMVASLNRARMSARDAKRIAEINQMRKAAQIYYLDHSAYPPVNEIIDMPTGWSNFIGHLKTDGLISKIDNKTNTPKNYISYLLPLKAFAASPCPPNLRPQDPNCECQPGDTVSANPITKTYSYISSSAQNWQYIRLRTQLENVNNPILRSGLSGDFAIPGDNGCLTAMGYYCVGDPEYSRY